MHRLFLALVVSITSSAALAQAVGIVVAGEGDCKESDRLVIETRRGFTLAEQYRGTFDKGDKVFGELSRYGFKDVQVRSGSNGRIYIDDYDTSKDQAVKWCFEE